MSDIRHVRQMNIPYVETEAFLTSLSKVGVDQLPEKC